tara:strand:+ start:2228 stop:2692 length:465 start_codon:yes stop_codon:yes gene_type:complete
MPNLTVTTKESIVLQGRQQGSSRTMTFANIIDVFNRTYSFKQQTLTSLYTTHNDTVSGAVFDDGSIKYVRITNLSANPLAINIIGENNLSFAYEIQKSQSLYLYNHSLVVEADDSDAITASELQSLEDIDEVKAYCHKGGGRVEVFIASTEATK